jgi:dolichol-phosphate mannosyltransferase
MSVEFPGAGGAEAPELAIVIPALNERRNVETLLPRLEEALSRLGVTHEIVVVDGGSPDGTAEAAERLGARAVQQVERGYGGALMAGFAATRAGRIVTMDADLSHPPEFIETMWRQRETADVLIASRYVRGGGAEMPLSRYILSRILNAFFAVTLSVWLRDLSSGFRMYRREAVENLRLESRDFDVLEEILCLQSFAGRRIRELPFHYRMRSEGQSHARIFKFGIAYLKTVRRLRRRRREGSY